MSGSRTAAGVAALAIVCGVAAPSLAQTAPSQITLVVAFSAGGSTDAFARVVAPFLADRLGTRIVIENRGGGAGSIGARRVLQAAPDGVTILVTTSTLAVNDISQKKGFSNDELRPLAIAASTPDVLTIHPSNPAKTLDEVVRNARTKSITLGSGGIGSTPWIVAEYFFKLAKVTTVHVPFNGGGPAIAAAIGGYVDVFAGAVATAAGPISQGQLRGIVVGSHSRSALAPEVPTFAEVGYPNFSPVNWVGFFVPAKTPDALVAKLNAEINVVMKDPEVRRKLTTAGFDSIIASHDEAAAMFKRDIATWAKMSDAIGYKPD